MDDLCQTQQVHDATDTQKILEDALRKPQPASGWDDGTMGAFGVSERRRSGAGLTCCFTTRFFTPSMTSWEPVFITLENSLARQREGEEKRGEQGGEGGHQGREEGRDQEQRRRR